MSLTAEEAEAVFDVCRWLGGELDGPHGREALELLAVHAGHQLAIPPYRFLAGAFRALKAKEWAFRALKAKESDGAAQYVCRELAKHVSHGGGIPWPVVARAFAEWQAKHAAATE